MTSIPTPRSQVAEQECPGCGETFSDAGLHLTTCPTYIEPQNYDFGFWGTWQAWEQTIGISTEEAWMAAVQAHMGWSNASPERARDQLDSKLGRHYADLVIDRLMAGQSLADALAGRRQ
ncbi:MAG: hypothetical protein OXF79_22030 [Chloroflexi bacterium]|nr:hypothetical protein [Chloroflexota bacterium]